jgi:hypothetical protein
MQLTIITASPPRRAPMATAVRYSMRRGRVIVTRSTTPMLDAARALLAEGMDPATQLVMRHAGAKHDAMRSTVGAATGLTVSDLKGRSTLERWRSVPLSALKPQARANEIAATGGSRTVGGCPVTTDG